MKGTPSATTGVDTSHVEAELQAAMETMEKHRATKRLLTRRIRNKQKPERQRREVIRKRVNRRTRAAATRLWVPWSEDEDEFVIGHHEGMKYVDIAKQLGRTYCAVRSRISKLRKLGRL